MNIAFIGPGIMPIPPDGWGAVEMLIWDYATILGDLGHTGVIINTPDREEILDELSQNSFDIVHLHYDVFHDIIPQILKVTKGKLIVSSHYPYINDSKMWIYDNYKQIINSYVKNNNFVIFASSKNDIKTFIECGAMSENCWLNRIGINHLSYDFNPQQTYDRTLSFSQICDRKRQYLIQNFDNIDFIGRLENGKFSNLKNYKGEYKRDKLNSEITKYSNFVLLSSVENTTPLVVKEALTCGLGVVVSESVAVELDETQEFVDVIPENKIEDLEYLKSIIEKNKIYSVENREKIREYGVNTFSLDCIIQNEYIPKLKTLLN
jgi:hypothetical protein